MNISAKSVFKFFPLILLVLAGFIIWGCSQDNPVDSTGTQVSSEPVTKIVSEDLGHGGFDVEAKYTAIRSYRTGGGVFILRLLPGQDFTGNVKLSVDAPRHLNPEIDGDMMNLQSTVSEIVLHPSASIEQGTYNIVVTAENADFYHTINLQVEIVFGMSGLGVEGIASKKRDAFTDWLETEHPELGSFSNRNWFTYMTYGPILVVEHWTFLDADWEFRLCFHVTDPTANVEWSKMMLRPRHEWDPSFAAIKDTMGLIYEMPVEDYPYLFGY